MGIWTRRGAGAALAAMLVIAGPAQAFCGGSTSIMMPIEFAGGSAALASGLAERAQSFATAYGPSGTQIDSLAITVMGDLGEGAEFDSAGADARASDKALAEARLAAIRDALASLNKKIVDTRIRESRQVFDEEDRRQNPMLNDRVRAGVFLHMMAPRPKPKKGEPVPTC